MNLTSDDLEALFPTEVLLSEQFASIVEMARAEGWAVDFGAEAVVRIFSPVTAR